MVTNTIELAIGSNLLPSPFEEPCKCDKAGMSAKNVRFVRFWYLKRKPNGSLFWFTREDLWYVLTWGDTFLWQHNFHEHHLSFLAHAWVHEAVGSRQHNLANTDTYMTGMHTSCGDNVSFGSVECSWIKTTIHVSNLDGLSTCFGSNIFVIPILAFHFCSWILPTPLTWQKSNMLQNPTGGWERNRLLPHWILILFRIWNK